MVAPRQRPSTDVMKDWSKYGVHIIEPVLRIVGDQGEMNSVTATRTGDVRKVAVRWESGLVTRFTTMGQHATPIKIRLVGEKGSKDLVFQDTYAAFKAALTAFVESVRKREAAVKKEFVSKVVQVIEEGARDA